MKKIEEMTNKELIDFICGEMEKCVDDCIDTYGAVEYLGEDPIFFWFRYSFNRESETYTIWDFEINFFDEEEKEIKRNLDFNFEYYIEKYMTENYCWKEDYEWE